MAETNDVQVWAYTEVEEAEAAMAKLAEAGAYVSVYMTKGQAKKKSVKCLHVFVPKWVTEDEVKTDHALLGSPEVMFEGCAPGESPFSPGGDSPD